MKTIIVAAALLVGCAPKDDSDPVDGRSGMNVYTDALTGCQYLGVYKYGLVPRMYSDGVQVCVEVGHD